MRALLLGVCSLLVAAVHIPSSREVKGSFGLISESATQLLQFSKNNECVSDAITSLHVSCQKLSGEEKSRMALKLTNCLLEKARKQVVHCSPREDIEDCTSLLSGDSWTSFTNFFTHIDNLCYYYRSLVWEQRTEKLVAGLSSSAEQTRTMLNENLESTREILTSQRSLKEDLQQSVELQKLLREGLQKNSQLFASMATNMSNHLSTVQNEIMTHYGSINAIFKGVDTALTHISNMQSFIMQEVVHQYGSVTYYLCLAGVVLLLGTTEMFEDAKVRALFAVLVCFLLERLIKVIGLDMALDLTRLRWVCIAYIGIVMYLSYKSMMKNRKELLEELVRATRRLDRGVDLTQVKDAVKSVLKRQREEQASRATRQFPY